MDSPEIDGVYIYIQIKTKYRSIYPCKNFTDCLEYDLIGEMNDEFSKTR